MVNKVAIFSSVSNFFSTRVFNNKTNTTLFFLFVSAIASGIYCMRAYRKSLANRMSVKVDIPKMRIEATFDTGYENQLYVNGIQMTNKGPDKWVIETEFPENTKLVFTINNDVARIINDIHHTASPIQAENKT